VNVAIHPKITQIGIWWDKMQAEVNVYFIRGKKNALIDTGPAQTSQDTITVALKELGLKLSDVDLILNTHGHVDHIGKNVPIKAASGAQISLHIGDILSLEDRERCFNQVYAPVFRALIGPGSLDKEKAMLFDGLGEETPVDRKLKDNDVIDLGNDIELRVAHLPGHSPGCVGFYWEKEGILFTGDSISGLGGEKGQLPIITDFDAYEKSLERLSGIPCQFLLCSHPYRSFLLPTASIRQGKEMGQFIHDSKEVTKRIRDAVIKIAHTAKGRPLKEITDDVLAQLPREMGFKRVMELGMPIFSATTVFWCFHRLY